ncbi:MAG: hypothetical protein ABI723_22475 [Bacteroidia bacterium]
MKPTLIKILILIVFLKCDCVKAQTIFRSWFADEEKVCMTLRKGKSSEVAVFDRIKCKIKGDQLTLIWSNNQIFWFIWERQKFHYQIIKLTSDSLILSQDPSQDLFELMPNKIIYFKASTCE